MSTLSGVFPNAITPTFAASSDPAEQSRVRRESEQAAFAPVEELEANVASRPTGIEQPGRLEAEQAVEVSSRVNRPDISVKEIDQGRNPDRADQSDNVDQRIDAQRQQADRRAEQDEVQLEEDIALIRELAARDREVKSHEQAHQSVGGQYAGAMEFTFKQGPDGKRYAVGGEVPIDVSKISGNPEATLKKAEQIRRAALAPAEPSSQDRQVAALASQLSVEAQNEIRQVERQNAEKASEERAEQSEISKEDETKTEASSKQDEEKTEKAASDSEDRLKNILNTTSDTVESALDAAYQTQQQQEVGFNLDTTV